MMSICNITKIYHVPILNRFSWYKGGTQLVYGWYKVGIFGGTFGGILW